MPSAHSPRASRAAGWAVLAGLVLTACSGSSLPHQLVTSERPLTEAECAQLLSGERTQTLTGEQHDHHIRAGSTSRCEATVSSAAASTIGVVRMPASHWLPTALPVLFEVEANATVGDDARDAWFAHQVQDLQAGVQVGDDVGCEVFSHLAEATGLGETGTSAVVGAVPAGELSVLQAQACHDGVYVSLFLETTAGTSEDDEALRRELLAALDDYYESAVPGV